MPDRRIQYVQSNDVDREKWDHCIASAPNSLIYNTSIYLDMMADHWNAVIVGDYEAVMPLPWRRKWFIRYHYHVPFIAQNGLTGNFSPETSKQVAKVALKKIGYGDLLLNYGNEAMAKHIRAMPLINPCIGRISMGNIQRQLREFFIFPVRNIGCLKIDTRRLGEFPDSRQVMIIRAVRPYFIPLITEGLPGIGSSPHINNYGKPVIIYDIVADIVVIMALIIVASFSSHKKTFIAGFLISRDHYLYAGQPYIRGQWQCL